MLVPPPDEEGRLAVLHVHTRDMTLAADVDLGFVAAHTDGMSGAEIMGVCREAALGSLRENIAAEVRTDIYSKALTYSNCAPSPFTNGGEISWNESHVLLCPPEGGEL